MIIITTREERALLMYHLLYQAWNMIAYPPDEDATREQMDFALSRLDKLLTTIRKLERKIRRGDYYVA